MPSIPIGSTSWVDQIFIFDSTSTTGGGKTGLAYNTSGLTCYYKRSNGTASVSVSLASIATLGTFVSGGFKEIDSTGMPGVYEFHPPNAALATGATSVTFFFVGATGGAPIGIKYELVAAGSDPWTTAIPGSYGAGTAGLLVGTALPSAAPAAAGGLVTCDSTNSVKIQTPLKKNTGFNLAFVMRDSSGNAKTGLSVTAQAVLNNGTFGSCTNIPSEIAYGWYYIVLAAADVNAQSVGLRFSASGAQDTDVYLPMLP